MTKLFSVLCMLSVLLVAGCNNNDNDGSLNGLAQCLTQKGAIFYGTTRCSHCNDQKAMFGSAMQYINFIDCDKEKQICDSAGIDTYPTWIFKKGSKKTGAHQLETLAREAECTYQASGTQL